MATRMKYLKFRNPNFASGMRKLGSCESLNQKNKYRVVRLIEWIEKEEKIAQGLWEKIIAEFAEKNEDGSIKTPEGAARNSFRIPEENRVAFEKKGMEWAEVELDYTVTLPIDRSEVNKVGLSAVEEMALEGFIEPLSEESPADL